VIEAGGLVVAPGFIDDYFPHQRPTLFSFSISLIRCSARV
jgi:hypothetical protein